MRQVAVLGGGPAGAFAAERCAASGLKTILIDEKLAWEKPCGGGLTYKAYSKYPFLIENDTPKRFITETRLAEARAGSVDLELSQPLLIYSRLDLNRMLLNRAEAAGAQIEKTRVLGLDRAQKGWTIRTKEGAIHADYCFIAMGARNPLKEVGTQWRPSDTATALGYYVPGDQTQVDIQFFAHFEGYIWVFPRCGHLSVGICGKGVPAHELRKRLEQYMDERGIRYNGAKFYGHMLPSLERDGWKHNRIAGEGWAALGDSAGLVDPITGEGLYYAVRSADLATQVLLNDAHEPAGLAQAYRALLERDFGADLEFGAGLAKRVFLGKFLWSSVPARMIQVMRRSPRFNSLMQDLFAGTQNYLELKERLLRSLHGSLHEVVMNLALRRMIPGANRV